MNSEYTIMFTIRTTIFKILLLPIAVVSLLSCEKLDDLEKPISSFSTEYYGIDFIVEATDMTGGRILAEEFIENDISSLMSQLGFNEDKIESATLEEAIVNIVESENYKDFNMLGALELTVYTESQGETKIAWSIPIPTNQSELDLDLTEADVLPYFKEDKFMFTAQGHLKQRINENVKFHAKVKFRIRARL